jgi:hypothetical protein
VERAFILALGVLGGAFASADAVISVAAAEAGVSVVSKVARSTPPAAALPAATLPTGPPKIVKPAPSPVAAPGFKILVTAVPETLPLSGENIASLMVMTNLLAIAPTETSKPAPALAAPVAVKPRPKSKSKPKLVVQEPEAQLPWLQLSWWRQPWLRLR